MKKCFKCLVEKPPSEFYAHPQMGDGHLNKCKECAKNDVKLHYTIKKIDPEYIIKERGRGREKYHRLYSDGTKKPKNKKKAMIKYENNNPEKVFAVRSVSNALRSGKLKRGVCYICGSDKVQGHHQDYLKPLEVDWLCVKHHNQIHVMMREASISRKPSDAMIG